MTQWRIDKRWIWVWVTVGVAAMAISMTGCSNSTKASLKLERQTAECHRQVVLCTQAIGAGDLAQAAEHLAMAEAQATSFEQRRQVQSLGKLLEGAEALMAGDGLAASQAWSQIEDPQLSREVRIKAQLIGMDVPLNPAPALAQEVK